MSWFKVDDGFHDHRKARQAGVEAIGLWLLAGTWLAGALTDGFVLAEILTRWHPRPTKCAQRLVDVGLWLEDIQDGERGYRFHDWKVLFVAAENRPRIDPAVRASVFERDEYCCVFCDAVEDLALDHIYPYSLGGPDTVDNLQVLCRACNSRKGAASDYVYNYNRIS